MSEMNPISALGDADFPSLEVMNRFLTGDISPEEQAHIEALLEDDPMMADAIEGLRLIKDPQVLQGAVRRIRSASQKRLNRTLSKREQLMRRQSRINIQPRQYLLYLGSAAAAFAMLFSTWYVIQKTPVFQNADSNEIAEAAPMETPPEATPPPAGDGAFLGVAAGADSTQEEKENSPAFKYTDQDQLAYRQDAPAEVPKSLAEPPAVVFQNENAASDKLLYSQNAQLTEQAEWASPTDEVAQPTKDELTAVEADTENERFADDFDDAFGMDEEDRDGVSDSYDDEIAVADPAPATSSPSVTAKPETVVDFTFMDSSGPSADSLAINEKLIALQNEQERLNDNVQLQSGREREEEFMKREEVDAIEEYRELGEALNKNESDLRNKESRDRKQRSNKNFGLTKQPTNIYSNAPVVSEEAQTEAKVDKARTMATLLEEAILAYQSQNYVLALDRLDEVLTSEPNNITAHHFAGLSFMGQKENKAAAYHFKKVLQVPESPFRQDAQWNLANAYILLNKKPNARSILRDIVGEGGTYAEEAQALLDRL